jgi:hypothetical protein
MRATNPCEWHYGLFGTVGNVDCPGCGARWRVCVRCSRCGVLWSTNDMVACPDCGEPNSTPNLWGLQGLNILRELV